MRSVDFSFAEQLQSFANANSSIATTDSTYLGGPKLAAHILKQGMPPAGKKLFRVHQQQCGSALCHHSLMNRTIFSIVTGWHHKPVYRSTLSEEPRIGRGYLLLTTYFNVTTLER